MSRWLSSVNNLLEKLDDQVENVRDVLTEQRDSDAEDEDYYNTESDDEEGEESSEEGEEEQIDLMAAAEDGAALFKNAFFPSTPAREEVEDDGDQEKEVSALETPQPILPPPPKQEPAEEKPEATAPVSPPQIPAKTASAPEIVAKSTAPPPAKPPAATATAPPKPPSGTSAIPSSSVMDAPPKTKPEPPTPSGKPVVKQAPPAAPVVGATKAPPQPKPKGLSSGTVAPQQKQPKPPSNQPPPQQQPPQKRPQPPPPKGKAPPPNTNTNNSRTPATSSGGGVNTNNKQQVLAEMRQLKKQVYNLQQELAAANKEIKAQQKELNSAATIVERERQELKEEKEDMLEDHEEEVEQLKHDYDEMIVQLKANHKQELKDMRQQLSQEKAERQQEGGDLSQDLEDALERERGALQEVASLKTEKSTLESRVKKLEMQQDSLQEKLESALASQETATQRQQTAEIALDEAQEQHKRQMKQRQLREAELEKTIADLGAALTATQQQDAPASITRNGTPAGLMSPMPPFANTSSDIGDETDFQEKYEVTAEEVETLKGQLKLESQRCEALRRELDEINQERTQEAATNQEHQRYYDQKLEEQSATIARLEATVRDQDGAGVDANNSTGDQSEHHTGSAVLVQKLQRQLEETKGQVSALSEQLLRQQGMSDVHKSEILALKGRLQAANARAEEAEKTAFQSPTSAGGSAYESEGGVSSGYASGYKTRRRVKGRGRGSVTIRSIRTALNMGPGSSMEGLGKTVEALDLWMIDTGTILRHEPLARLAFFVYFSVLHLWCFCLVAFHTSSYETPHADFPSSLRGARGGVGMTVGGPGGT